MVSVIIPCHNCANFIDRAVSSVMAQSYPNIEIILVENNSTDNTLRVLRKYQSMYPHLITVSIEFKKGAPAARNCGLSKANGEWIQFLDADDELLEDKIYTQLNIANHLGADVIAGGYLLKCKTAKKSFQLQKEVNSNIWKGLITSNLGITSSNLWRKAALTSVNGWNENLSSSQEYDLLFRMIKNSAIIIADNQCNTQVHFSENSISKSSNKDKLEKIINNRINLRLQIKDYLQSQNLLSSDLDMAIDEYIYTELISNSGQIPEYCTAYLKQQNLNVNLETVLRVKTKHYIKQVCKAISL